MHPTRTATHEISIQSEAGDLYGWLTDDEARQMIRRGKATVLNRCRGIRRIQAVADVNEPLRGSARVAAVAGYVGAALLSTYVHALPDVGAEVRTMKRFRHDTGELVVWRNNATGTTAAQRAREAI